MNESVYFILESIFGHPKKHSKHKGQISFNCPECDDGRNKGNLEVNYHKGVFKCWVCKNINNMYGTIGKLIYKYGGKDDISTYKLINPEYTFNINKSDDSNFLELIPEMCPLTDDYSAQAMEVKQYLYGRGLTDEHIKYRNIQYSRNKDFKRRVIIPSYDSNGVLNYYISRKIYKSKVVYDNPEFDKQNIIFFESSINWDSDIYLVEGVFDAMVIPNSIPLLGKYPGSLLINTLTAKARGKIIILLDGEEDARKDAVSIYDNLNKGNLKGRVKMIHLYNDIDVSKINELYGVDGIKTILKNYTEREKVDFFA